MKPLLSALSRYFRRPYSVTSARTGHRKLRQRQLRLEALENRTLMTATVSVAGATLNEIGSPSAFIPAGSGGLQTPSCITLGPDGNVYVAENGGAVLRFNSTTGAFISTFVTQGSGGLSNPGVTAIGMAFGPDRNLYIVSGGTNQVLEYNGTTGTFIKAFISAGSGGLDFPRAVTFGSDGSLYVTSRETSSILRYQGPLASSPGAPLPAPGQSGATFVAPSNGGLVQPIYCIFGPDGNLYVDGSETAGILRYNGTTGAFMNTFAGGGVGGVWVYGRGMAFDQNGNLYVGDSSDAVHRYNSQGASIGDLLVNSVNPTLREPLGMTFDAQGDLLVTCSASNMVVRYDRGVDVTLSVASSTPVSVNYTTIDGSAMAGTNYFADSGTVTFAPGQTSQMILLATEEDPQATGNVSFTVQLSNATGGATIGASAATVTIAVADATRQFSIANTSAIEGDTTAHYRGAFVQGLPNSSFQSMAMGPDGNLYVNSGSGGLFGNGITAYNGSTGALIGEFVQPVNGQIETTGTVAIVFNAGYLYVGSLGNSEVLQYNGTTGAFVSVFISGVTPSSPFPSPFSLAIGPDANGDLNADLYVSSSSGVSRYNATTGAFLGTYIANGSGGLSGTNNGMTFDPTETYLYVTSSTNQVLKYNALTGAYVGVAASAGVSNPRDVKFGPDGLLYVLSAGNNRILRYTATGTYVDDYVPAGCGGMVNPFQMTFGSNGDLYVSAGSSGLLGHPADDQIFDFGTENEAVFTVTNTTSSTLPLTVNYSTADGTAVAGRDYTATSGTLTFAPGWTTQTVDVPLLGDGVAQFGLSFTLNISKPTPLTVTPDDWTSAGLTLTLGSDGNLHVYTTGTTTDAVAPVAPASISSIDITSPSDTTADLTIDSSNGNPIPAGGLNYSGAGGLNITGSGVVTLAGPNSYTGGTTVFAGTILLKAGSALPGGTSLTVGAGGTFVFDPSAAASNVRAAVSTSTGSRAQGGDASPRTSAPVASFGANATSEANGSEFSPQTIAGAGNGPTTLASTDAALLRLAARRAIDAPIAPSSANDLAWLTEGTASWPWGDQGQKNDRAIRALDALLAEYEA